MEALQLTGTAEGIVPATPDLDRELMAAAARGDGSAFDSIVQHYGRRVHRQCMRRGLNTDEAADVSQDVFLKVYRSLGNYSHQNAFSTWLYRVTDNACIDYLRSRQRRSAVMQPVPADDLGQEMEFAGQIANPEAELNRGELGERLQNALDGLSHILRESFEMRELEGLRYEHIARRLGVTVGTVKSRIFRARQILCETLSANA